LSVGGLVAVAIDRVMGDSEAYESDERGEE
jgi:hypothetical protein